MTKKEKLECFKLVEPKLREKYLNQTLKQSDFEALNIKGKDLELFLKKYEDFWIDRSFESEFNKDSDFWNNLESNENAFKLDFPDDICFYQFGVPNLDIERLKTELESKTRILYINKITGAIETLDQIELYHVPDDKNIQNRIKLVIEDPIVFLEQLKNGEIDTILTYDKKNPTQWEVPKSHPISQALNVLDVDKLIEVLADDKNWILYNDTLYLSNGMEFEHKDFKAFDDFQQVKLNEMTILLGQNEQYKKKTLQNRFFFKVENPSKMRAELLKGNMKILDEIKSITFSSFFFNSNNEV
jgi:hypothetical protein